MDDDMFQDLDKYLVDSDIMEPKDAHQIRLVRTPTLSMIGTVTEEEQKETPSKLPQHIHSSPLSATFHEDSQIKLRRQSPTFEEIFEAWNNAPDCINLQLVTFKKVKE